jgi:glycerol-3-phosphate dehydrogenase
MRQVSPPASDPCYDVVIVGGGIAGCAIAYELAHYALRIALLDKEAEVGFGTTKANSGVVHGGHHASPTTLKGRLEWEGNRLWDALCAELGFGFHRCGELTVALAEPDLPVLRKLLDQGQQKGIPGLEFWPREQVLRAEPNLSPDILAAVYAPATGVVNPYEACFSLAESAAANGVAIRTACTLTGLAREEGVWTLVTTQGFLRSRFVVNAAGLFSDAVAQMAGVKSFAIHPRKGEEYLLDKRLAGFVRHVIFPCPTPVSKGILIIPTYDGTLMVGPTAHSNSARDDLTTTAEGAAEVFAAVRQLAPGISERDCIAQFAGLRAAADGEDFIIGPTAKKGFINVAGIQSPGLTAAPAIARMVAEILTAEGLPLVQKAAFAAIAKPVRLAGLPSDEQAALAGQDERYRRIACRCEFVTEGEVLDAIARGARTLDGVKFRTRAGMGRCQGGFCTSRCMELLARSQGVALDAITKRGGGSWIVLPRLPIEEAREPEAEAAR